MKRAFSSVRGMLMLAAVIVITVAAARPAFAQVTYTYEGHPFTQFSCSPNPDPGGFITCGDPAGVNNPYTSYTATDRVRVTIVLDQPLPANLPFQDIDQRSGFQITMSDGRQTMTLADATSFSARVGTDATGAIVTWEVWLEFDHPDGEARLILTEVLGFGAADEGALTMLDPDVPADLAYNSNSAGTWTLSGQKTPTQMVQDLIDLLPTLGLTKGQVNSFTTKLTNVLASIAVGSYKQATNQLQAFINAVNAAVANGQMSVSAGATLIAAANAIIAALAGL